MNCDVAEQRFIQVLTRQGLQSSFTFIGWVDSPTMTFTLKLLNDNLITEEHLRAISEYGGTHGMGQERGRDWARYELVSLQALAPTQSPEPSADLADTKGQS